jgi:hypothetical protein
MKISIQAAYYALEMKNRNMRGREYKKIEKEIKAVYGIDVKIEATRAENADFEFVVDVERHFSTQEQYYREQYTQAR